MLRLLSFTILIVFAGIASAQIRFAFLTDIHVVPGNEQEKALQRAVDEINTSNFDFVVVTGDLTNMGSDIELENVKSILDNIKIPYHVIPGNHETNWSESAGITFSRLWGNDRFSFTSGNYRFIGYSTGPYMKMGDGLVKNEDVNWLSDELERWTNAGQTVINLAHYPLTGDLSNYTSVVGLLKKYNVPLSLCGHGHTLQMMDFDGVKGLMGRALIGRDRSLGYNTIVFRNDSAFVGEKILGENEKLVYSFKLSKPQSTDTKPINTENIQINANWLYQDSCSVMDGAAIWKDKVFIANSCGVVKCIDTSSGAVDWQFFTGQPIYAKPFTDGRRVYIGTTGRGLMALNIKNGIPEWEYCSKSPVVAPGRVVKNRIYIGLGSDGFACLDAQTGKDIWKFSDYDTFVQAEPVVTNDRVIFGAWDTNLYCLNRSDGSLIWKWNNGSPVRLLSPGNVTPAVAGNRVFLVAPDRYLTILNLEDGSQILRTKAHQVRESMGITNDGMHVVAKTMNDSVIFVDTRSLAITSLYCGFGYEHNPCPMTEINGVIYGGTRQGVLFAIDRKRMELQWSKKLGNSSITRIADAGKGRVLVSLMEGVIVIL